MLQIRPVSDFRNKFPDIEQIVNTDEPVYLTKNGYGAMVVLSLEEYSRLGVCILFFEKGILTTAIKNLDSCNKSCIMIVTEPTTPLIFMRNPVGLFIYEVFYVSISKTNINNSTAGTIIY